jgi:pimeloyl-ACP methyl ester carboxylesterase
MSGNVIAHFALKHPDRVDKLVIKDWDWALLAIVRDGNSNALPRR